MEWNVQTIIALVVVVAFSLAALTGIEGVADLKDIALVVVGFYSGTKKKSLEVTKGDTKLVSTEEHINERGDKDAPQNSTL